MIKILSFLLKLILIDIFQIIIVLAAFTIYAYIGYGWPFVGKRDKWSIGILTGKNPFKMKSSPLIKNPVLTAADVTDIPAEFVADPFMVKTGATWNMFFEVLNAKTNLGEIALATSTDGMQWTYQQIVLKEAFHLSYPYVFQWNGNYYMIPESSHANSIRLYKATKFPTEWNLEKVLLDGTYRDTSVINFEGKWWMFTANPPKRLHLYYADDLLGPWIKHPKSPLINRNPHIARPGGRVIVFNNHLIRFTQDDWLVYGNKVRAFEVLLLTTTDYAEKSVQGNPLLKHSGSGWNRNGMHSIDPHQLGEDDWIACVDGFGY
jgi:hypothetical protein